MIPGLPDYDDAFAPAYLEMCTRLKVNPLYPLRVGMNESGMHAGDPNPAKDLLGHNSNGHASGLWQLMPDTARDIGWDVDDCSGQGGHTPLWNFRRLSPTRQLPWFERYFAAHRGQLISSAACYLCVFMPADIGLAVDPQAVIVDKSEADPKQWRRGWAYSANAGFDENGDLKIQVFELEDAILRAIAGSSIRYNALLAMLNLTDPDIPAHDPLDLTTAAGQERALTQLGLYKGAIDGIPGPFLRAALLAFQHSAGLKEDGIPGPITRQALAMASAH